MPGAAKDSRSSSFLATYVRRDHRYIILNMRHIINIDTGQEVQLELPALANYIISAASNGWAVAAMKNDVTVGDYTLDVTYVYEFDIDGGAPIDSYAAKSGVIGRGSAFIVNQDRKSVV